jgi:hypothetical protein
MITIPTSKPRRTQNTTLEIAEGGDDDIDEDRMAAYGKQASTNIDLRVSEAWWKIANPEEQELLKKLPVRRVNLVGFDAEHARKRGLSIVTADTIVKTKDGKEIILRAVGKPWEIIVRGNRTPDHDGCKAQLLTLYTHHIPTHSCN